MSRRLAKTHRVIGLGRDGEKLESLRNDIGAAFEPYVLDVSNAETVGRFGSELVGHDEEVAILVNCAGFARGGKLDQSYEVLVKNWDEVLGTNLSGAFYLSAAIAPAMSRPDGRIIFVSSIAAYTGGRAAGSSIYAASKSGLHGLVMGFARELSSEGMTVNAVAPGFIEGTGFIGTWPQERIDAIVSETPVGRPGTADEIASTVEYLCSPSASFITGEIMKQNGN